MITETQNSSTFIILLLILFEGWSVQFRPMEFRNNNQRALLDWLQLILLFAANVIRIYFQCVFLALMIRHSRLTIFQAGSVS